MDRYVERPCLFLKAMAATAFNLQILSFEISISEFQ